LAWARDKQERQAQKLQSEAKGLLRDDHPSRPLPAP
jgi:hypothetical protein